MIKKLLSRVKNRIAYIYARTSPNKYANFLRAKGCRIGKNVWWGRIKTIKIDYSRPLLVDIGDDCRINTGFTLMTHDSSSNVFRVKYHDFVPSSGLVKIGNNVYFGRHCTVLKGVNIGDNCIIGYGSLVTKDIPANSVAAGRPAKVICDLDTYYQKRKKIALEEAFAYARRIQEVTGRKPTIEEMYEEFPYFMDGDADDSMLKFPISHQTRGFYEEWKTSHKAPYKDFDDFLKAAGIE